MELDALLDAYALAALAVLIYMLVWFAIGTLRRNNGVVDVAWGIGFIVICVVTMVQSGAIGEARGVLVTALVAAWGVRLAVHIFTRSLGAGEDWRYARWRQQWGRWWVWRSLVQVYLLQGAFMIAIAGGIIAVAADAGGGLGVLAWAGAGVAAAGLAVEAVADAQLRRFIKHEKREGNRFIQRGLWAVSRHPNYLGEAVFWWGIALIALPAAFGWLGAVGALVITLTIRFVSGVPMLEDKYADEEAWRDYARRVPVFVPWPGSIGRMS